MAKIAHSRTRPHGRSFQSQLSALNPLITQVLNLKVTRLVEMAGGIRLSLPAKMSVQGKLQSRKSKEKNHAEKEDAFK